MNQRNDELSDDDPLDEPPESRRSVRKRESKEAGKRSTVAARALMELKDPIFARLKFEEDVAQAAQRARAVKAHSARRREERHLAGVLRNADLDAVEAQLERTRNDHESDGRRFKQAESWRDRLIAEGDAALQVLAREFVLDDMEAWQELVAEAQSDRAGGIAKGAARRLFRKIMALTQEAAKPRL